MAKTKTKKHGWDFSRGAKIGFKALLLSIPAMFISNVLNFILAGIIGVGTILTGQLFLGIGILSLLQWIVGFMMFGTFLWRYWNWVKKDSWL